MGNKSETELTASVLGKKNRKHTEDQREHFSIAQNRTKRAHFRGSPLFQATYNIKTEEANNELTWLLSVKCWEAKSQLEKLD